MVGHAVQGEPNNFDPASPVQLTMWAPAGTTFVQGVNALLNIVRRSLALNLEFR